MDEHQGMAGSNVDWAGQTVLHPLGLVMIVVCGIAMLWVPRKYAVWPMIATACLVASAQRIVLGGLDFSLLRIMVLFGWIRIVARNESAGFVWKPIDSVLIAYAASSTISYTILLGSTDALVNRLGASFDAIGMYFMFRCLIRSWEDVSATVLGFVLVSVPIALAFFGENRTGRNIFAVFGGVPAVTMIRDGRLRCQGAYSHPILAGCFWAGVIPLIAARFWQPGARQTLTLVGLGAALLIVMLTASSTPIMGVMFAVLGGAFFLLRERMSYVRWSLVALLASLHMVMNKPVWHLIARINIVSGSTAWHRYYLLDQAINRVGEWWFIGTKSTSHWGWGLQDITNQFILEGVRGGLATLVLFVTAIVLAFRGVGQTWRASRSQPAIVIFAWALGVALFTHCMNFLAVSYFGQIIMVWYLTLAIIASMTPVPLKQQTRLQDRGANAFSIA